VQHARLPFSMVQIDKECIANDKFLSRQDVR